MKHLSLSHQHVLPKGAIIIESNRTRPERIVFLEKSERGKQGGEGGKGSGGKEIKRRKGERNREHIFEGRDYSVLERERV